MGISKPKDEYKERLKQERKKRKERKLERRPVSKKKMVPEGVRGIIRIAETDVDGTKRLKSALLKIKGLNFALAYAIPRVVGLDPNMIAGTLTDKQIEQLEQAIREPAKFGIPSHMLNRRIDPEDGKDKHLVASSLVIQRKLDIDKLKKIRCYRGIRHELGLPVRGQRTRSSFRKGARVGVMKKGKKGR